MATKTIYGKQMLRVSVYLTQGEYMMLQKLAAKAGQAEAEYMREKVLGKRVQAFTRVRSKKSEST